MVPLKRDSMQKTCPTLSEVFSMQWRAFQFSKFYRLLCSFACIWKADQEAQVAGCINLKPAILNLQYLVTRHRRELYASCSSVADFDFVAFHDNRHLPYPVGKFEHIFELIRLPNHIHISGSVPISRPGFVGVGSGRFSVNDYFVSHFSSSLWQICRFFELSVPLSSPPPRVERRI